MNPELEQWIKNYIDGLNLGKPLVNDDHRHTGLDKPQVYADTLIPYSVQDDVPGLNGIPGFEGQQFFYDTNPTGAPDTATDFGQWFFLGNEWNRISYAPEGMFMTLIAPQSIPNGVSTTILFDSILDDDSTSDTYDDTTGEYSVSAGGRYLLSAQATFDFPVTGPGTNIILSLYTDNGGGPTLRYQTFVPDANAQVSISMSMVQNFAGIKFWFTVEQSSGDPRDIIPVGTFLSVKKFVN